MFSVGSEQEAERLLVLACPTNIDGDYLAPELVDDQTLENLDAFGERLAKAHNLLVGSGWCDCVPTITVKK